MGKGNLRTAVSCNGSKGPEIRLASLRVGRIGGHGNQPGTEAGNKGNDEVEGRQVD